MLIELIKQLKPKQWEKIMLAAVEASKVMLNVEDNPTASTSNVSDNRPKPQLRDNDPDV